MKVSSCRYGDPRLPERFWERVQQMACGCWFWLAGGANGYGQVFHDGRTQYTHRVTYEALVGSIPEGLQIYHLCRNRICVNPAHLEPVTRKVNILRGTAPSAANAVKTHCHRGHEFNDENTYRDGNERVCKVCRRLNHHLRKQRRGVAQ